MTPKLADPPAKPADRGVNVDGRRDSLGRLFSESRRPDEAHPRRRALLYLTSDRWAGTPLYMERVSRRGRGPFR